MSAMRRTDGNQERRIRRHEIPLSEMLQENTFRREKLTSVYVMEVIIYRGEEMVPAVRLSDRLVTLLPKAMARDKSTETGDGTYDCISEREFRRIMGEHVAGHGYNRDPRFVS